MQPDPAENFGVNLGAMAIRGERGTLIVSVDSLTRMSSNPFFPYLLERIGAGIGGRSADPEAPARQVLRRLPLPPGSPVQFAETPG